MQISKYTKSLAALMAIGVMVPSASATNTEGMRKLATTSDKVVTMPGTQDEFISPTRMAKAPTRAEQQAETLLFEDFSKFTAGSEDNPDPTMLPESYLTDNNPLLPEQYTHKPGWWGMGIYQAGGTCFLGYPEYGGIITTPGMNMNGVIRITFKGKAAPANGEKGADVILCFVSGDPYNPTKIVEKYEYVALTSEWAEYTYDFNVDYTGDDACLQINGITYDAGKYIDDLKIERIGTFLSTPRATEATEYTGDSFVANWQAQLATDDYLLTAYTRRVPEGDDITAETDFSDGKMPEYISGENVKVTPIIGSESDNAIELGQNSVLIIDGQGGLLHDMVYKFWMQLDTPEEHEQAIYVDGWNGTSWQSITISNVHNRSDKPEQIVDLGKLEDQYPAYFRFRDLYTKVRITGPEDAGYRFYFDDLKMTSSQPIETIYACNETPVKGTSYKVTGMDPNADYEYYVQAVLDDEKSDISNVVKVYQLLKPTTTEATDVDPRGGFTANWNALPKAEEYQTMCYRITDVTADNEAYPLLTETFKGATKDGATLDTPYLVGNDYASESLDDVADNVGWSGIGLAYAGNMVGCGQDMGMSQLESPTFDASHNNGVFNVSFNCYGTPGEMMVVQNAEISYQYVSLKEGVTNYNLTFEDGADNTCLVFYVMNGTPFLIGDVKVTQSMKAGEQIRTCLATSPWIAETSYFFSNAVADGEDKIGYTVQARYKRDLTWYYSPLSDVQIVEDKSGVDDIQIDNACSISLNGRMLTVEADAAENVAVYTINGTTLAAHSGNISMTLPDKGVYIVRVGDKVQKIFVK